MPPTITLPVKCSTVRKWKMKLLNTLEWLTIGYGIISPIYFAWFVLAPIKYSDFPLLSVLFTFSFCGLFVTAVIFVFGLVKLNHYIPTITCIRDEEE